MRSMKAGLVPTLAIAVTMLLAGCGGASESEGGTAGQASSTTASNSTGKKTASGRTDMPPADYVPYRCTECSCRIFMGDGPDCSRPACKHHWSAHQQPTG